MPSYIVKINKEDDFYVYWSEIAESPHTWGTKEEVSSYMRSIRQDDDLQARFDRADENGTSAFAYAENYGWEDTGVFIYDQLGMLRRNQLGPFLKSYNPVTCEFDLTLLEPFENEEDDGI